jgi:pimeloyl-ACP methyl ester carboxylesterase
MKKIMLLVLICAFVIQPVHAQSPQPERIEIEAEDGLILVGNYYAPAEIGSPALLLMHHGGGQKELWYDFIPVALDAGYAVLTVDLRGHGETGGAIDLQQTIDDSHRWLAWLREQPDVDPARTSIVGASMGGDVGLNVMAEDPDLVTVVSISPLLELDNITTTEATSAIGNRPVFLIAGRGATEEADAARTLFGLTEGEAQVLLIDSDACCTYLFMFDSHLMDAIIGWLDRYN